MIIFMELIKAFPDGLVLGVLQDEIKKTLEKINPLRMYLSDGRTRSVKHAMGALEKYGIISEEMSPYGERIYSIRLGVDDYMGPFLNVLCAIDDLTDKPKGQLDHVIPRKKLPKSYLVNQDVSGKLDGLDRCTWKFNVLEAIERMLWEEKSMKLLLEYLEELGGTVNGEIEAGPPSLLDYMANHVGDVQRLREFYSLTPIERVYASLIYLRESLLDLLSSTSIRLTAREKYTTVTLALFQHFINICRTVLSQWIDLKLAKKVPRLVEYSRIPFFTFALMERIDVLPGAVRKKFNLEKAKETIQKST